MHPPTSASQKVFQKIKYLLLSYETHFKQLQKCFQLWRERTEWVLGEIWELNVLKGDILGLWGRVVYLRKGAGIIGGPCGWMPSLIPNSHLSKDKL